MSLQKSPTKINFSLDTTLIFDHGVNKFETRLYGDVIVTWSKRKIIYFEISTREYTYADFDFDIMSVVMSENHEAICIFPVDHSLSIIIIKKLDNDYGKIVILKELSYTDPKNVFVADKFVAKWDSSFLTLSVYGGVRQQMYDLNYKTPSCFAFNNLSSYLIIGTHEGCLLKSDLNSMHKIFERFYTINLVYSTKIIELHFSYPEIVNFVFAPIWDKHCFFMGTYNIYNSESRTQVQKGLGLGSRVFSYRCLYMFSGFSNNYEKGVLTLHKRDEDDQSYAQIDTHGLSCLDLHMASFSSCGKYVIIVKKIDNVDTTCIYLSDFMFPILIARLPIPNCNLLPNTITGSSRGSLTISSDGSMYCHVLRQNLVFLGVYDFDKADKKLKFVDRNRADMYINITEDIKECLELVKMRLRGQDIHVSNNILSTSRFDLFQIHRHYSKGLIDGVKIPRDVMNIIGAYMLLDIE
jgi:hypothetical protein